MVDFRLAWKAQYIPIFQPGSCLIGKGRQTPKIFVSSSPSSDLPPSNLRASAASIYPGQKRIILVGQPAPMSAAGSSIAEGRRPEGRPARHKRRSWLFRIEGVTNKGENNLHVKHLTCPVYCRTAAVRMLSPCCMARLLRTVPFLFFPESLSRSFPLSLSLFSLSLSLLVTPPLPKQPPPHRHHRSRYPRSGSP